MENTNIDNKIFELTTKLDNFSNVYSKKMKDIEKIIDDIQISSNRPEVTTVRKEENLELFNYVRKGLLTNDYETKSLNSASEEGGAAIFPSISNKILEALNTTSVIRKLANVENISSNSFEILLQKGEFAGGWVQEKSEDIKETKAANFERKVILAHELYSQPKASQRFLDDSIVNVESWLVRQISSSFTKLENESFLFGEGKISPKGFLTYEEEIQHIECEEENHIDIDDITNLINSLSEEYLANSCFLMHRSTLSKIQHLQDNNGRFIWEPSYKTKGFDRLFGIPLVCCNQMPRIEAQDDGKKESKCVVLADFKSAYTIVDRHQIRFMRDPYTEKPFVKFYATKRVGGDMVNFNAMSILKA